MPTNMRDNVLFVFTLFVILIPLLCVGVILVTKTNNELSTQTQQLCWEYAHRDHKKEIAPTRYEYLGKEFVDSFSWYESCLNHVKYPVAK